MALVVVAGTGFAAFTATATVNGRANAASVGLDFTGTYTYACDYWYNIPGAPGNISVTAVSSPVTSISVTASNLTPGVYCTVAAAVENTGSVPENISVALETAGSNGMCTALELNCYTVFTWSGISNGGNIYWIGAPNYGTPTDVSNNFVTLQPGASFFDFYGVTIPEGSNDATPASAQFTLVYTASAGL